VTLMEKDVSDGQYRTTDNKHSLVYPLLNKEANDNGYNLRWDANLMLRNPIIIHIGGEVNQNITVLAGIPMGSSGVPDSLLNKYHLVPEGVNPSSSNEYKQDTIVDKTVELIPYHLVHISGEVKKDVYIKADGRSVVESVNELQEYLNSNRYAIGDKDDNTLLSGDSNITEDMNIIVMKRNVVSIDIKDDVLAVEVNISEIAKTISALTGIDVGDLIIDLEVDEEGYVISVLVIVEDGDKSNTIVAAVNELDKGSQCEAGVLCHSSNARIILIDDLSLTHRCAIEHGLYLVFLVFIMIIY